MAVSVIAWQLKKPRHIILMSVPGGSLWAIQYILLDAPTGAIMNIFAVLKDGALGFVRCSFVPYIVGAYMVLIWAFGLYFLTHWYDLLALFGASVSNIALLKRDNRPLIARACIASQLCWIAYNSIVGAWIALACGILVAISSFVGMYRHENWNIGICYRHFIPNLVRSLFDFSKLKTYP